MPSNNDLEHSHLSPLDSETIIDHIVDAADDLYVAKEVLENIRHHNPVFARQFNEVINKLPKMEVEILNLRTKFQA